MLLNKRSESIHVKNRVKIDKMKKKLEKIIDCGDYESALLLISCLGNVLFQYNQYYTDIDLEKKLILIQNKLENRWQEQTKPLDTEKETVFFYDGFGLDLRGLALIYLEALAKSNYNLVYIVRARRKDKIPTILSLLNKYNAEIIFFSSDSLIDEYDELCRIMTSITPRVGFLYTFPDDVAGIMAFMYGKDKFTRFQINLTDHAFWLGINAFDYCIEFRDYGAGISYFYRNISKDKIIKLPYYPYVDRQKEFEGFPFPVEPKEFIIFSGGSLYKTFDGNENLYYKIVDFCLSEFSNVKFWYAGTGDSSEIEKLEYQYPGRVFFTAERDDLFQVMSHVDMYLNTYPMGGGLMVQYAALAGKIPVMLHHGDDGTGLLLNHKDWGIEFNEFEELKDEIRKIIGDEKYRIEKGNQLKSAVVSQEQFAKSILEIIEHCNTEFDIDYWKPDTKEFLQTYRTRFETQGIERILAYTSIRLLKYFPGMFVKGAILSKWRKSI